MTGQRVSKGERNRRERQRGAQAAGEAKAYRAGIETAKAAIAPMIMRRYFVRGLALGVVLGALAVGVVWRVIAFGG